MATNLYIRFILFIGLNLLLINNGFSKTFIIDDTDKPDTSNIRADSTDTIIDPLQSKKSKDAPETTVKYFAKDSIVMDNVKNMVYLYKDAKVEYGQITLKADTIIIYLDKNELYAKGGKDSLGRDTKVFFQDGEESFEAPEMAYNFKTKKGKIIQIVTEEDETYILAEKAKRMDNEDIFIQKGKITTCDAPDPHFYFLSERLKVKPGKFIVSGPTHLVIRGIHTPIWVPFGIFPNNAKRQSGVLIPGPASERGFNGLRELGYHWAINDYVHADFLTDVFFDGSFRANAVFNYKKRYRYNGSVSLRFNQIKQGITGLSNESTTRDLSLGWRYNQDPKAHPKRKFSVNIDAKSPTFNQSQVLNSVTAASTVQAYNRSSVSWAWNDKWGAFQTTADFNQNFGRKEISARAPNMSLRLKQKPIIGNLQYRTTVEFKNEVSAGDSTFFTAQTLDKMNSGIRANTIIDLGSSYKILKYVNLTVPSINVNTYGNFQSSRRSFVNNEVVRDTVKEFRAAYDMSLGNARLNTKIFGTYKFKDGMYVKAFRHIIDPTVSFSYNPDFFIEQQNINRDVKNNMGDIISTYSIYENSMYRPMARESFSMNYQLNNVLQAKIREKTDSATNYKKANIIQALNFSGNHNFLADSLNWSNIRFNLNANPGFLKNFNIDGSINPYGMDSLGRTVDDLLWKKGSIGRLTNFSARTAVGIERKDFIPRAQRKLLMQDGFNWNMNINYTFAYRKPGLQSSITNSLDASGSVTLNNNLNFAYNLAVDMKTGGILGSTTYLEFRKDLHCWEMTMNWFPFNDNVTYVFTIRPKSGMLRDLKQERRRGNGQLQ